MLYPSVGEMFYLKLLLLHTSPRSFLSARTVDGTVHKSATRALGLSDDDTEGDSTRQWILPSTTEMLAGDIGNGRSTSKKPIREQRKHLDGQCLEQMSDWRLWEDT